MTVDSARQAIELMRRGNGRGLTLVAAEEVIVDANTPEVPVGIDGETVIMPAPVRCTIRPQVLRVLVPKDRPGVPPPKPAPDWPSLRRLASFRGDPSLVPLNQSTASRSYSTPSRSAAEPGTTAGHRALRASEPP